jgi:hypothetical protein
MVPPQLQKWLEGLERLRGAGHPMANFFSEAFPHLSQFLLSFDYAEYDCFIIKSSYAIEWRFFSAKAHVLFDTAVQLHNSLEMPE